MLLIVAWMCLMVLAQICIFRYFLQSLQNIANFGGHFCSQMNHLDVLIGVPQWQTSRCGSECRFFIWERVPHQEHQAKEGGHRRCVVTVANGAQSCWNTLKEQMSYPNGGTRELSWCIYPPVPILYWLRAASRDTNSLAVWVYHGPSHQTEVPGAGSAAFGCRDYRRAQTRSTTPVKITWLLIFLFLPIKWGW